MNAVAIRDAVASDIASIHAIYSHQTLHGFGTFEETPPPLSAMEEKWRAGVAQGLPWLVAEENGAVIGYTYASVFRPRTGYRYTIEDSVYLRDDMKGRGLGTRLLKALIPRCEAIGARQVVAVIGDSQNLGSIGAHRKAGFTHAGTIKGAGYKLGRWVDIVLMQLALNGGDQGTPPVRGAWT